MMLRLQSAGREDLHILAEMNKQLIEDESSSNSMGIQELEERMREFFENNWGMDLIMKEDAIIGYALYQYQEDSFHRGEKQVYLRQYFIRREYRNMGYGIAGIDLLRKTRFKDVRKIELDVLEKNPEGKRFWDRAGFRAYYTNMRLENS